MVLTHTEIRWIIFFAAKDGEALYSQQKQDRVGNSLSLESCIILLYVHYTFQITIYIIESKSQWSGKAQVVKTFI